MISWWSVDPTDCRYTYIFQVYQVSLIIISSYRKVLVENVSLRFLVKVVSKYTTLKGGSWAEKIKQNYFFLIPRRTTPNVVRNGQKYLFSFLLFDSCRAWKILRLLDLLIINVISYFIQVSLLYRFWIFNGSNRRYEFNDDSTKLRRLV